MTASGLLRALLRASLGAAPFLSVAGAAAPLPAAPAAHVVVVVWDGLRPDLVSQVNTPVLARLARNGVTFSRHHPVYPSTTEVNGVALNTGDFPDHTTILANREYRPALDPLATVSTENPESIRQADAAGNGKYLPLPTVAEFLQGLGFPTVVAGTKGVALLADRRERPENAASRVVFMGEALPPSVLPALTAAFGPFPPDIAFPNTDQDGWTTRVLADGLWRDGVPKFSLLWLSEPDYSQHQTAPGALTAASALRSSDTNLGHLLDVLEKRGLLDSTDVLVVSDHGFSTLSRVVDVADYLAQHGLPAVRRYPGNDPGGAKSGAILVDGLGGSVYFYVPNHDAAVARRAALLLQQSDFAGVLFSRDGTVPGTFPLAAVRLAGGSDQPDLALSMRWSADLNRSGIPGSLVGDSGRSAGQGMHGSLSRFDMHNTLVAAGPDFKRGWIDEAPSGNIDIAPTVLALLGIANTPPMDGRVLGEAFLVPPPDLPPLRVETEKRTAAAPADRGTWSQYLVVQKVNGTVYFDEGNGALSP